MTVHCDGVLRRRVYKLILVVGRDRDRAVLLARIITAIYNHSGHLSLPWHDCFSLRPFLHSRNAVADLDCRGIISAPRKRPTERGAGIDLRLTPKPPFDYN